MGRGTAAALVIFGIIASIAAFPFYIIFAIGHAVFPFIVGIIVQIIGAILIASGKAVYKKTVKKTTS